MATYSFPPAANVADLSINYSIISEEINLISQAILARAELARTTNVNTNVTVAGNTPMTYVSGVQSVTVVSGGTGYVVDTPSVQVIPPNGATVTNASLSVVTNGGAITGIDIIDGGTGYQPVYATLSVGSVNGADAVLTPVINSTGVIIGVDIVNPGTGYAIDDTILATRAVAFNPSYVNASIKVVQVGNLGQITGVSITNGGSGYQPSVTTLKIVSTLDPSREYITGIGFASSVVTNSSGVITNVVILNSGTGYTTLSPYLVINDTGTGATTAVTSSNGTITSVDVVNSGYNYTSNATGVVYNPSTSLLQNPPVSQAVVDIVVNANTFNTVPTDYWYAWTGLVINKTLSSQITTVLNHFRSFGYTVNVQANPSTGNTIQWAIFW